MNMMQNDYLMKQIDEIRDKAKSLQAELFSKEEELAELEISVSEKEKEVQDLENKLELQKKEATEIVTTAKDEMSAYAVRIENDVNRLINEANASVTKLSEQADTHNAEVTQQIETLKQEIAELDEKFAKLKEDVFDKTHSESLKVFRNIQSCVRELQEVVEAKDLSPETIKKIKSPAAVWALIFSIINFLLIGGYILVEWGIIHF